MDIKTMLFDLSRAAGVSGVGAALDVADKYMSQIAPTKRDSAGGIFCSFGSGEKKLMLDAHIDEIGFIVTAVEDGFIRVGKVGGVDLRCVINAEVTVHGKRDIKGVFASLPPHLKKDDKSAPELDSLAIDCGLSEGELKELVSVGDMISFSVKPKSLIGSRVTGKSLDNRAGAVAIISAAERLAKSDKNKYTVCVALTAQEELGIRGAKTAAFEINPDEAIVVDVSFGDGAGLRATECGKLGEGAMIGISPILSREMTDRMFALAKENGIKFQPEVMGGSTGTNADAITVNRAGVKTSLISVPLRNMHTCCEVVDLDDIKAVSDLIVAYAEDEENA